MINIILFDLPPSVRGFCTKNEDDTYTIFVNGKLSLEEQRKAYEHELRHIQNNDFNKLILADVIESEYK